MVKHLVSIVFSGGIALHGIVDIEEVLFFVPDVSQAKKWYMGLLAVSPMFDDPNYCAFQLGKVVIGLHPEDAKNRFWRRWAGCVLAC
jgi:hypothetical protein